MKMTYNQAVVIQRAQMAWYRRSIGRAGVKEIRRRTFCPVDLDPNEPVWVGDINKWVPRGGSFESLIRHRPTEYDPTKAATHNAIRRGLI